MTSLTLQKQNSERVEPKFYEARGHGKRRYAEISKRDEAVGWAAEATTPWEVCMERKTNYFYIAV